MGGLAGVARGEQHADIAEAEAGSLGHADDTEPSQRVFGVTALAADSRRFGKQSLGLVVADGRDVEAGAPGDLADAESGFVQVGLDLKPG